jgi:hypothetical protein
MDAETVRWIAITCAALGAVAFLVRVLNLK